MMAIVTFEPAGKASFVKYGVCSSPKVTCALLISVFMHFTKFSKFGSFKFSLQRLNSVP